MPHIGKDEPHAFKLMVLFKLIFTRLVTKDISCQLRLFVSKNSQIYLESILFPEVRTRNSDPQRKMLVWEIRLAPIGNELS